MKRRIVFFDEVKQPVQNISGEDLSAQQAQFHTSTQKFNFMVRLC
ncbi:hypothetical protein HZS_1168, partial [Henneguya salminicola]